MFLDSLCLPSADDNERGRAIVPLRAHAYDGARRRSNERDAFLCETFRKMRIFTEETVPRMYCLCGVKGQSPPDALKDVSTYLRTTFVADFNDLVYP